MNMKMRQFQGYCSRWDFIIDRCKERVVLHLGCIGITEGSIEEKVRAMLEERVIHALIRRHSARVVGIDYDRQSVDDLRRLGYSEIVYGDVMRLKEAPVDGTFDIVVCGDLIEHLSNPGDMLEGIKRFVTDRSDIIITTPNAFGGLHFLRYLVDKYQEGGDHVLSLQLYTLENLLKRHGYTVTEAWTCYNRPPGPSFEKIKHGLGIALFKIFPKLGGTLCVVAKLQS